MSEFQDRLPPNWIVSSLGEICSQPQYGYTTKASDNGTLRLLRTTDITSGSICWDSVPFCLENPADEEKYLLEDGDIVISRAGSVGVSYLLKNPERSVFASYLIRFKPYINTQYFKYFLDSPYYWQEIADNKLGIAVPNVNASKLKEIEIPLPPENEQHRIVAKIEELFSELDKGIENLKTAQAQLEVYRQALLKHAFEGKLTARWREQNRDKVETAAALQQRIQQERAQRYQQQFADWKANGGSKPKAPKPLPPLTAEELAELPELPEGWGWFAMGEICLESVLGKMLDKEKNKGELRPYLRNINVRWGKFDLDDLLEMRFEDSEFARYGIADGDLVVCEGGEPGRCAVWRKEFGQDMKIQKALHRIRFTNSMNSSFVQMYFELCASNRRLEKMFTGTTIKHLTGEKLTRMAIPICSMAEQIQILLAIETRFSESEQLDQTITTSLQQAEVLRQSILKKAFSGQLVSQDPHDEPASALLARIRVKREQADAPKRGRRSA